MKIKLFTLTAFITIISGFSNIAFANGSSAFEKWDNDKDNQITLLEMKSAIKKQFNKSDKNKDGQVTIDEFLELMPFFVRPFAKPEVEKYFSNLDQNGDSKLNYKEMVESSKKRFIRIDIDKNNFISIKEFDSLSISDR